MRAGLLRWMTTRIGTAAFRLPRAVRKPQDIEAMAEQLHSLQTATAELIEILADLHPEVIHALARRRVALPVQPADPRRLQSHPTTH